MSRTPIRCLALLIALAAFTASLGARSGQVSAELIASEVLVEGSTADATFTIEVTNGAATPATNVRVIFADGAEVGIGDVAGEAKASSETQRRVIDMSSTPTRNLPVEATLKYTQDGADVESAVVLIVRIS